LIFYPPPDPGVKKVRAKCGTLLHRSILYYRC
jgi:hypothetical protein